MKKQIIIVLGLISITLAMTSCELFGLSYAFNFKQSPSPAFGQQNCTAYEFIASRAEDDFSLMKEAIDRTNLQQVFEDSVYTYFILKDDQWDDYLIASHYSAIQEVPEVTLKRYILSYVIPGYYNTNDMNPGDYFHEQTLNDSITMRVYVPATVPTSSQNLHSLYAAWLFASGTGGYNRGCITSNIDVTNGIVHVLASRLIYVNDRQ